MSGTFDGPRDYCFETPTLRRQLGRFDLDWLLRSLRFGLTPPNQSAPPLAIDGAKGLPAIESFILARLFMFQQVYFHKSSRASEWMLTRILSRVHQLLLDGTRLPQLPPAIEAIAARGDANLGDYLALDDAVLWVALSAWRDVSDPVLRDLTRRLLARHLFKTTSCTRARQVWLPQRARSAR